MKPQGNITRHYNFIFKMWLSKYVPYQIILIVYVQITPNYERDLLKIS